MAGSGDVSLSRVQQLSTKAKVVTTPVPYTMTPLLNSTQPLVGSTTNKTILLSKPTVTPHDFDNENLTYILIGVFSGVFLIISIAIVLICIYFRKRKTKKRQKFSPEPNGVSNSGKLTRISYDRPYSENKRPFEQEEYFSDEKHNFHSLLRKSRKSTKSTNSFQVVFKKIDENVETDENVKVIKDVGDYLAQSTRKKYSILKNRSPSSEYDLSGTSFHGSIHGKISHKNRSNNKSAILPPTSNQRVSRSSNIPGCHVEPLETNNLQQSDLPGKKITNPYSANNNSSTKKLGPYGDSVLLTASYGLTKESQAKRQFSTLTNIEEKSPMHPPHKDVTKQPSVDSTSSADAMYAFDDGIAQRLVRTDSCENFNTSNNSTSAKINEKTEQVQCDIKFSKQNTKDIEDNERRSNKFETKNEKIDYGKNSNKKQFLSLKTKSPIFPPKSRKSLNLSPNENKKHPIFPRYNKSIHVSGDRSDKSGETIEMYDIKRESNLLPNSKYPSETIATISENIQSPDYIDPDTSDLPPHFPTRQLSSSPYMNVARLESESISASDTLNPGYENLSALRALQHSENNPENRLTAFQYNDTMTNDTLNTPNLSSVDGYLSLFDDPVLKNIIQPQEQTNSNPIVDNPVFEGYIDMTSSPNLRKNKNGIATNDTDYSYAEPATPRCTQHSHVLNFFDQQDYYNVNFDTAVDILKKA